MTRTEKLVISALAGLAVVGLGVPIHSTIIDRRFAELESGLQAPIVQNLIRDYSDSKLNLEKRKY